MAVKKDTGKKNTTLKTGDKPTASKAKSSKEIGLEDDDDLEDDLDQETPKKIAKGKSKKSSDDDDDDDIDVADDWEKPEEDEDWDKDFDEFDVSASKIKKAAGKKKRASLPAQQPSIQKYPGR